MSLVAPAVVAEDLIFRSSDGSLALAGIWMVAVGLFIMVASLGNVFILGPWAPRVVQRFPKLPRFVLLAWGVLGAIAGSAFVTWPFFASPGHLY